MAIHVQHITKRFKGFTALNDVSLEVKDGELVALLGPSGSGKTTLLRIIAGLEKADSGSVLLQGEEANDKGVKERQVGFVFQHYALFKHMTVFDNVAFGLTVRPKTQRPGKAEIKERVERLLHLVHLEAFADRYPHQLSGGQRQRVALARSLAVEPKVLLLDEPFGALDAKVRKELRRWMRKLHDEIHVTSVFVTHDQEEAMEVSDRVVVMSNGRIEQVGTPGEVYHQPKNSFVYDFLGNYNQFEGWRGKDGVVHLAEYDVEKSEKPTKKEGVSPRRWLDLTEDFGGLFSKLLPKKLVPANTASGSAALRKPEGAELVTLYARPHEMWISRELDEKEYIAATVIHVNPAGPLVKIELERKNGALIQVEVPKSIVDKYSVRKGETLFVTPKSYKLFT